MMHLIMTILGVNAYMVYVILFLIFSPRRKRDADGNIIFEDDKR